MALKSFQSYVQEDIITSSPGFGHVPDDYPNPDATEDILATEAEFAIKKTDKDIETYLQSKIQGDVTCKDWVVVVKKEGFNKSYKLQDGTDEELDRIVEEAKNV